jgi:2-methylcitrate dehydratase PrpD
LFDAKMSIPYCLAVLVDAGRFDEALMEAAIGRNTRVTQIANAVRVASDDAMTAAFPKAWPSSVEVTDSAGRTVRAELAFPKGEPENPLTETEIVEKFLLLSDSCVDRETALGLADTVLHIDRVANIRPWLQSINAVLRANARAA